jgi:hypothetical protein
MRPGCSKGCFKEIMPSFWKIAKGILQIQGYSSWVLLQWVENTIQTIIRIMTLRKRRKVGIEVRKERGGEKQS